MDVLEMKDANKNNKEIFEFFNQLKIEEIQKLVVEPDSNSNSSFYYTYFVFETKDGTKVWFHYAGNKRIISVGVRKPYDEFFSLLRGSDEYWLEDIWNQFVDHFNLRIRLMFINETTPWKWETAFTY